VHGAKCVIAAGSEIDLDILYNEISMLSEAGLPILNNLMVDESATVLSVNDSAIETAGKPHGEAGLTARIGSTGKGVGAARASRIMREAHTIASFAKHGELVLRDFRIPLCNSTYELSSDLSIGCSIIIEGTQGYGLGLHTDYYPFTTSSDARAIDFLAQAGVSPWEFPEAKVEVWLVARTFPIRVAGNSGPLFEEITWENVGQNPEYTTVTKKQRRIGRWNKNLVYDAIANNGGNVNIKLVLTFLDYVFPSLTSETSYNKIMETAEKYLVEREHELKTNIAAVGTGPNTIVKIR
jgi:adenylosuccinate synthase